MPQVKKNYIDAGKVRFIYRPFVFDMKDDNGRLAAESLYCAGEQGKFWEMNDWLYADTENDSGWVYADDVIAYLKEQAAPKVELDGTLLESCLREERFRSRVATIASDALNQGISATPTFSINGNVAAGAMVYEKFAAKIEEALQK